MTITHNFLRAGAIALITLSATGAAVIHTADAAYAERGGSNNGRANSNRDRDRSSNRGSVASELRGLNAAHANQNALESASPNSMPGKLFAYQQGQGDVEEARTTRDLADEEFNRLIGLTTEEIEAEFPDGGYEAALETAATNLTNAQTAVDDAESGSGSLDVLTGGRELTEDAIAELGRLLGL